MCRSRCTSPGRIVQTVLATLALAALCLLFSSAALAQTDPTVMTGSDPTLGTILTDSNGMTLYARAGDTTANVTCTGSCVTNWPLLTPSGATTLAPGVPGMLSTFTRPDGSQQVAYNGMPLYYWHSDQNAGDVLGQGVGGFTVVTPMAVTGK